MSRRFNNTLPLFPTEEGGPYDRCLRCSRALSNEAARAIGYGSVCARIVAKRLDTARPASHASPEDHEEESTDG